MSYSEPEFYIKLRDIVNDNYLKSLNILDIVKQKGEFDFDSLSKLTKLAVDASNQYVKIFSELRDNKREE